MGRILLVTWEGGGNVLTVLALADRLRARGHAVRAMGTAGLAGRFAARDVPYVTRDVVVEWDQRALAHEVRAAAGDADVVVTDYTLPGALCGAEASYRPSVALVPTLYAANREADGGLAPMHVAATVGGIAAIRDELGLPPVTGFGPLLDRQTRVLVTCPEGLDDPGPRPRNVRYVGPVHEGPGPDAGWRPPGVDDGRPLVVMSVSTTPMDAGPVLQRLLTALADAPARVIVTLGAHVDPDGLSVPADVHLVGHVRDGAVLPWASAVVSHGSLDIVLAALAHGLPQVCLPLGGDQARNAAAVERVGAGCTVSASAAPHELRAAVGRALDDMELRAGAARMALAIDAQRAAGAEVEVEHLLGLP